MGSLHRHRRRRRSGMAQWIDHVVLRASPGVPCLQLGAPVKSTRSSTKRRYRHSKVRIGFAHVDCIAKVPTTYVAHGDAIIFAGGVLGQRPVTGLTARASKLSQFGSSLLSSPRLLSSTWQEAVPNLHCPKRDSCDDEPGRRRKKGSTCV